jgi:hypothetical protein
VLGTNCKKKEMGHLAVGSIYLKSEFMSYDSAKVTVTLKTNCKEVKETRKGRYWEIVYNDTPECLFHIYTYKTLDHLHEIEEEMIELEITPEEYPEIIVIVSYTGGGVAKDNCQDLVDIIAIEFDCLIVNARLVSYNKGVRHQE